MKLKSAFPFKDPQTDRLHRGVVAKIQSSDYDFQLPLLNDKSWSTICDNAQERERLEFLGDALIGAYIAEELYRQRPDGGPGYYTVARVVLTANSTFAHLMNKAGLFDDLSHSVKPAGDALETIFAALHSERGADAFQAYARQYFLPLIETVGLDYDAFRISKAMLRQRRLKRMALKSTPPPGSKWTKKGPKKGKKANNFRTMTSSVNPGLPKRTELQQCSFTSIRTPIAIIDLTEDSDDDTEKQTCEKQDSRLNLSSKKTINKAIIDLVDVSIYPDQTSITNNSTAVDSDETQDLLISISASSPVVSSRKNSEDKVEILSPPTLGGHASGEDVVQDDLVSRFEKASLFNLGTIHNPITVD